MIFSSLTLAFSLVLVVVPAIAETFSPAQLFDKLRGGGYTLYFRHAATDWSQSDNVINAGDWRTCESSKIRQLSDSGRASAERIGKAIKAREIPIGAVLSSEYCPAIETVERMDLGSVKATTDIMNLRAARFVGGNDKAVARMQAILKKPPSPRKNRIISGHGNLARAATGAYPSEGALL